MTAENQPGEIPEWAQQEREGDIRWLRENLHVFWPAATQAFKDGGRGAIVVDTTSLPVEGMGHPFGYYLQETVEETGDDDVKRMVSEYDPTARIRGCASEAREADKHLPCTSSNSATTSLTHIPTLAGRTSRHC